MLSIEEAREEVLAAVRPLPGEFVSIGAALGRVLAEDVASELPVPPFDNSAMDGFAVAAGPAGRRLRVVGESRAGVPAEAAPGEGEALRISTGALVPPGTEAVVPVEQVREAAEEIVVEADVRAGQHVRRAGEDMRAGEVVLTSGATLWAAELGVAVGAGRRELRCARRPRVSVVATGDELVPPGTTLAPGQIHDSNAITLAALSTRAGAEARARHAADTPEATREALGEALVDADVLIVSGGVSVGPHDHVKGALDALGVQERFWRVALRPGKPTWFGTRGDQLVFGLPGNPVSAMVTFLLFVRPALARLQGAPAEAARRRARLAVALPRHGNRDEAVRVRLEGDLATPTGPQGSHQLTSMLHADALAIVPRGEGEIPAGAEVDLEPI